MSEEKIIHIDNLNVKYEKTIALQNVCLDVYKGDYLGIMGPNGGGKSTLLKAILGLIPITSGKIEFVGQDINSIHQYVGYVPQFSSVDRGFPISVLDVVLTAMLSIHPKPFYRYTQSQRELAYKQLENIGIKELAKRQISELSGGEFQRLLIARALATNPKILFLDEPCANVDPSSRAKIYSMLSALNSTVTIVMVTHDLNAVASQVTSIACLNQTLVYHGKPELTSDIVTSLYGCPVDLIAHGVPHRVLHTHEEGCPHD